MKTSGACVSSHCECLDGLWACTDDCAGGICVDRPSCTTPNPSGCRSNEDCDAGYDCMPPVDASCIPLDCACTALGNTWDCREMCGGGECIRS